jgi:hypothetical protein
MTEPVIDRGQASDAEPGVRDQAANDEVSSLQPQTTAAAMDTSGGFGSAIPAAPIDLALLPARRSRDDVNTVAIEISAAGAAVGTAVVDALDEKSVSERLVVAVVPDPAEIDLCACAITGQTLHACA